MNSCPMRKNSIAGLPRSIPAWVVAAESGQPVAPARRDAGGEDARAHCDYSIVVIGASLGGTRALSTLLSALPGQFPLPIAIVLHRAADGDATLRHLLHRHSALPVLEAEDKMPLAAGHAYLAPADYHLLVGNMEFSLSTEAPVGFARPSIDVLFESASAAHGSKTLGVVLTVPVPTVRREQLRFANKEEPSWSRIRKRPNAPLCREPPLLWMLRAASCRWKPFQDC